MYTHSTKYCYIFNMKTTNTKDETIKNMLQMLVSLHVLGVGSLA